MDYAYNYAFLRDFVATHHLKGKDILEALESTDYASLRRWLEGKTPVHITAMLKLCNYYNIPLANFFTDADGLPANFAPTLPDNNSQPLPTGEYGMEGGAGRGIVETRITRRTISTPEQSVAVVAGLKRQADQRNIRDAALSEQQKQSENQTAASTLNVSDTSVIETVLRLKLDHSDELRRIEREYQEKIVGLRREEKEEREKLIDIIDKQQCELSRLRVLISDSGDGYPYNNIRMMAAEPEPEPYGRKRKD